jgi:hypothetical protein
MRRDTSLPRGGVIRNLELDAILVKDEGLRYSPLTAKQRATVNQKSTCSAMRTAQLAHNAPSVE